MGNALAPGEAGLLGHVAHLAMDGDDDLGPDPFVHGGELGPAGVARDVDRRVRTQGAAEDPDAQDEADEA